MNKVLSIVLICFLAFGITGCSNSQTDDTDHVKINNDNMQTNDKDKDIAIGRPDNQDEMNPEHPEGTPNEGQQEAPSGAHSEEIDEEIDLLLEEFDDLDELGDADFDVSLE